MLDLYQKYSPLKVLLCHDWLTGMRGGEKCLELLCENFPDSQLYTLIHNEKSVTPQISSHVAGTSWLQYIPQIHKYYRYGLPLFPQAIESIRTPQADLLISTSHCVAKGLSISPKTRHLCYCFTPMRYAWVFYDEYFGKNPFKKVILDKILIKLRKWDYEQAQKVTRFVAISKHIQDRIQENYGRPSDIVYPPVDVDRLQMDNTAGKGEFDLIVSALVPYKRVDLAVKAYKNIDFPLKIVGTGTEFDKMTENCPENIEFMGWQSDDVIKGLYQQCRCLIFPGEEDFGIVPVEAQACGRPVVAYGKGGALETVVDGVSGVFFDEQSEEALVEAITRCASTQWDKQEIRRNAERFSTENYLTGLARSIDMCLAD